VIPVRTVLLLEWKNILWLGYTLYMFLRNLVRKRRCLLSIKNVTASHTMHRWWCLHLSATDYKGNNHQYINV